MAGMREPRRQSTPVLRFEWMDGWMAWVGACVFQSTPAAHAPSLSLGYDGAHPGNGEPGNASFMLNHVLKGRGVYREAGGAVHRLGPGTVFLRVPGRAHVTEIEAEDYCECYLFMVDRVFFALREIGLIDVSRPTLQVGQDKELLRLWTDLHESLRRTNDVSWRDAVLRLGALMDGIASRSRDATDAGSRALGRARRLLEAEPERRLPMAEISAELGMTAEAFRKWFTRQAGVAPGAFRIRRRIQRACHMLRDHEIKEVAYDLGYPDTQSFTKQFVQHTGMTPKQYQRLHQTR